MSRWSAIKDWFESWTWKSPSFDSFFTDLRDRPGNWTYCDGVILFSKRPFKREWTIGIQSWTLFARGPGEHGRVEGLNPLRRFRLKRLVARQRKTGRLIEG